jgi:type IV secretion system protein VirB9
VGLGILALAGQAAASTLPLRGHVDSRVREIAYNPDDVIRLPGYVGYQIHLEFAPGEEFVNLAAGDMGGLEIGSEHQHLMIKPKQPKVNTNLTVITSQHVYQFDYNAVRKVPDPRIDEVIYSLRFTYPLQAAAAAAAAQQQAKVDAALRAAPSIRSRNTKYWFCGDRRLRPLAAFDDGVQTHLVFAPTTELPAIFVKSEEGAESLVNVTVEAAELVVHRLASRFILRRGPIVGCVENRSFAGAGEPPPTGTVTPAVKRHTVGVRP